MAKPFSAENWYPEAGALYNAAGGGFFYINSGFNGCFNCARRETRFGADVIFDATLAELRALVRPRAK